MPTCAERFLGESPMKKFLKPTNLPVITASLGGIALVLRKMLYAFAVDAKGLLPLYHPLEIALGLLSAGALVYILLTVWKLDGSAQYADNFAADRYALAGHIAAAAGIVLTVLTREPMMPGYLGQGWLVLGYLAPVCLVLAGIDRYRGRQPFFLLHLVPCLFLVFHIVNHYQFWSGNPQLQDYVFTLFGSMALMFFGFYNAAFDANSGRRRMQLFMGMAAVYLLLAELAQTRYPWLYLGGILWALTGLCTLTPVPKPEPEPKEEK